MLERPCIYSIYRQHTKHKRIQKAGWGHNSGGRLLKFWVLGSISSTEEKKKELENCLLVCFN
jgi:hypothetical protein